jgi:hypothetical protein
VGAVDDSEVFDDGACSNYDGSARLCRQLATRVEEGSLPHRHVALDSAESERASEREREREGEAAT